MDGRLRRSATWLLWLALCAHFAQVLHFASVPHFLGDDGHLHHACDGATPDDDDEDGEDPQHHRCPILLPALDPCGGEGPPDLSARLASNSQPSVVAQRPPPALEPLTLAPKHSPPIVPA